MKIKEISIIQFGKLHDLTVSPSDGMNVIFGQNESGKSTLLAFIKFVLYGLARRSPSIPVGERERAISWGSGTAAGSLTVEDVDGRIYRIERVGRESAKGTYADKVRILDGESGEEVFSGEVPGEHFLGIPAQAYDSMCNIKQLETSLVNGEAVRGVIEDLLSSGDESTSVQGALKLLDAERRRLLHSNGRGGLVYESQSRVESLRTELRVASSSENELIKNQDELETVDASIAEATREFELAKMLCDAHDDVIRLEKFKSLREVRSRLAGRRAELGALACGSDISAELASYEVAARLGSVSDSLERAVGNVNGLERELEDATRELAEVTDANIDGLSELLGEHASPRSAISYFEAKRKKRSTSSFLTAAFGVAGGVLLAFAVILAFAMNNIPGGATVAFIGILLVGAAVVFLRRMRSSSTEIAEFCSLMGVEVNDADAEDMLARLESFSDSRVRMSRCSNLVESAKFRLSAARDALAEERERASDLLLTLGVVLGGASDDETIRKMREVSAEMGTYLTRRGELESSISGDEAVVSSLESELSRFSERDIRARISPELEQRLVGASIEDLKSARDAAFKRTSNLSQYKAGIERNLASAGVRRKSQDIFPELEAEEERLASLNLRLSAVKLAAESLQMASTTLKRDLTPKIRARAQEILAKITNGKYTEIYISDSLGISLLAEGEVRNIEVLSRGGLDAAYLAVRLALIETLTESAVPPIFMDECLSQLDDDRARGVLRAVAEYARTAQCILLTCQTRDVQLAEEIFDSVKIAEL